MKIKTLLTSVVLPLMVTVSLPAAANNGKTYPGALCQPKKTYKVNNHGEIVPVKILRDANGWMFNLDEVDQVWTCPIVRDQVNNGDIVKAYIWVKDDNDNRELVCYLKSRTHDGFPVDVDDRSTSNGFIGNKKLVYEQGIGSEKHAYYFFRCRIPGKDGNRKSGIRMYMIEEHS